ncbi:MAG: hypothetical protein AAF570_03980 [Bacteroidota bacterium]
MKVIKSLLLLLFVGNVAAFAQENYNDFIPVGPAPIDYKIYDGRLFSELTFDEANNQQVINLLPNELTHKSIIKIDKDNAITFSAIELSEKGHTYVVKTDYIKYTTLPVKKDSETGEIIGVARVGLGIRVDVTLKTSKSDITVTDLYALGTMVGPKGSLSGHISVSVMGIETEEVTTGFPVNAEISPSSIAATLQAIVLVKNKIYDKDTHLTPQVLEIKYTDDYKTGINNIMDLSMPIMLPNRGEPCVVIK